MVASNDHALTPLFWSKRFQTGKTDRFFINLDPHNSTRLNRKSLLFPEKSVRLWQETALLGS